VSSELRIVLLALVLGLLVVPLGMPYALLGITMIAGLASIDLWHQHVRAEAAARGEVTRPSALRERPLWQRLVIVIGLGLLAVTVTTFVQLLIIGWI
jgi:hypothetical protein